MLLSKIVIQLSRFKASAVLTTSSDMQIPSAGSFSLTVHSCLVPVRSPSTHAAQRFGGVISGLVFALWIVGGKESFLLWQRINQ